MNHVNLLSKRKFHILLTIKNYPNHLFFGRYIINELFYKYLYMYNIQYFLYIFLIAIDIALSVWVVLKKK